MKSQEPKVLHRLCGRPLIAYPITLLQDVGIKAPIVVVGHQAERVKETVLALESDVVFVEQTEQRGTGHAVMMALPAFKGRQGRVLILPGDDPLLSRKTIERLFEQNEKSKALVTVLTATVPDPTGYGRIVYCDGCLDRIVEEKDADDETKKIAEVNSSVYVVDLNFLVSVIENLKNENAQGEYYLTDLIGIARRRGGAGETVRVSDYREVIGINSRVELAEVASMLKKDVNETLMRSGVTLEAPETAFIDGTVNIGTDVIIAPFVTIKGNTTIGKNVRIGPHVVIADSAIGNDAAIEAFSHIDKSKIGEGCVVGPFARLRPESELKKGAKVGNFVEMKKSVLGEGSKANHLSYVGDAEIGAHVNVGAGTITCNYDGFKKYKTVLEDGVFIGSNSSLVAPVKIGAGAIVGAGSVITKDVEKDAIAVARGEQRAVPGGAKRFRERNRK